MGYTTYWTQKRDHTKEEWADIMFDVGCILDHISLPPISIKLVEEYDKPRSKPLIDKDHIRFNGAGDEGHETFMVHRHVPPLESWQEPHQRGWSFCKTAHKPYDLAVVAVLCYLGTVAKSFSVSSDGDAEDWLAGLQAARDALPKYADILDIPVEILRDERWCSPYVDNKANGYAVRFCKDGHGYVLRGLEGPDEESYRFDSHVDLARWLEAHKEAKFRKGGKVRFGVATAYDYPAHEPNIWRASGAFDKARYDRIAQAQAKALSTLFPVPAAHAFPPPAIARPGQFPEPERRPYYYSELLQPAV